MSSLTFEQIAQDQVGTIYLDKFDEGLRLIILRGPASLCAYIGVPADHPLAGHSYDDIPVQAHGGLTFSSAGDGKHLPSGFWWYGMDYAHVGDKHFYDLKSRLTSRTGDTPWTVEMVEQDAQSSIYDFRSLLKLSERIAIRPPAAAPAPSEPVTE